MVRTATIGLVGLASFAVSGTSQADQIDMTFTAAGIVLGEGVSFSYDPGNGDPLYTGSTTAGRFDWTVTSDTSEGPVSFGGQTYYQGDTYSTFCSEITESVSPGGNYTYTHTAIASMPSPNQYGSPMGTFRAGLLQELFDNHYGDATNNTSETPYAATVEAAAFQVAVWEIIYEGKLDAIDPESFTPEQLQAAFDAGNVAGDTFFVSGNGQVVALANVWLDDLLGDQAVTARLIGFGSDDESIEGAQNQISYVPLPAPIWLASMGLLGIVIGRKRLRRLAAG